MMPYNHIMEGGYVGDLFKEAAGPDPGVGHQVIHCVNKQTNKQTKILHNQYSIFEYYRIYIMNRAIYIIHIQVTER